MSSRLKPTAVGSFLFLAILGASDSAAAPASKPKTPAISPASFPSQGLAYEKALNAMFRGEFEDIVFNREDMEFSMFFMQYLASYSQKCLDSLPADKVEVMTKRCVREEITKNGWGVEISRVCVKYVPEPTGVFTRPQILAAVKEVEALLAAETFRNVWRLLPTNKDDPYAGFSEIAGNYVDAKSDMDSLVRKSPCVSASLRRFEDNLRLFALNLPSIRLEGYAKPGPTRAPAPKNLADEEYTLLIEALVANSARDWVVNRYRSGSVGSVSVAARDEAGFPTKIVAGYAFEGFNGLSRGTVDIRLAEGWPTCMYFFDSPAVCRSPSRAVAAKFASDEALTVRKETIPPSPPPVAVKEAPVPAAPREDSPERTPAAPVQSAPPAPSAKPAKPVRVLEAVSYIQGIKDACADELTSGDLEEKDEDYCYCLSAAAGSIPISDSDAQWLFENFGEAALDQIQDKYSGLERRFTFCKVQRDAV